MKFSKFTEASLMRWCQLTSAFALVEAFTDIKTISPLQLGLFVPFSIVSVLLERWLAKALGRAPA